MKNNPIIFKKWLLASVISLLTPSALVMSATYDPSEFQKDDSTGFDQIAPLDNEFESSPSFLDSLQDQDADIDRKNKNYFEVLNLFNQKKYKEARDKISTLLKENPDNPGFYNLQAILETLEKNTSAAQDSYNKALKINPKNVPALLGLAKIMLEAKDIEKSREFANKALLINNKSIYAYLLLADIALSQKSYAEVETVLIKAHEKVKGNFNAEMKVIKNLAKFYASQKQSEKLLPLSEDLVKRYPNNSQAMSVLANVQIVNNKKDLAEQTLRQLINQEKQDVNHRLVLARLLIDQPDQEKQVLQLLDETAAIQPNNPRLIAFKASYLIKLERYPEALELANKSETSFPKSALSKLIKGEAYLKEKKWDKALENYQQAYEMEPYDRVLFKIVDLLNAQKNQSEAITYLNKALEKNPKNSIFHFKLATTYQSLNDNSQAEKHYQAILNEQPDNVLALNNLALLYSQQNNPQAIELAKKAYALEPRSAAVADTYGYILFKQGQLTEALSLLEKAVSLEPHKNIIQFHLAKAYAANDNKSKAIEILENITKAEQRFSEKNSALDLLNELKAN